ncbi:MAG: hypothetical protein MPJ24_05780 [Pirellulaceae bacterium]|nr:hypothetical protein [Pirellulaceae bacterium]
MQAPESRLNEVDQLLLNAQLRDEIEPYMEESFQVIDFQTMPTEVENEFLSSMIEWEKAPVVPIGCWFEPPLSLEPATTLADADLQVALHQVINDLFSVKIVLDFSEHLSDRELYELIRKEVLPAREKRLGGQTHYTHWRCLDHETDCHTWLRYYASEIERQAWSESTGGYLPQVEPLPYQRDLPSDPVEN